jgi:hypothetical protein
MKTHTMNKIGSWSALMGLLVCTACIFDTRDADPPDDTVSGCTLDSPQKVFTCMAEALNSEQDGNYERSLADNFLFSPTVSDSLDQLLLPFCVYENWTKPVEMDVLQLMLSDNNNIVWDFGTPVAKINKNTFVRFEVNYSLSMVPSASPTDTLVFRGIAEIDVRNVTGNWKVTFWNEVQNVGGATSWGFLRGDLRKQQGATCAAP